MTSVLGVDAAWTVHQPSGVALITEKSGSWRVVSVAPSYEAFISCSKKNSPDWYGPAPKGSRPEISELLEAARNYDVSAVDLIALDIPLARGEIASRRSSDKAVSKAFGARGCATHSPNAQRPGRISAEISLQMQNAGYSLQTVDECHERHRKAIEVYPHPALLTLLGRDYRVPYKVSRSGKYWKSESVPRRIDRILAEFLAIYQALEIEFGDLKFNLPESGKVTKLAHLKQYEDALDALVCAWVGKQYLMGRAQGFGDSESTIWIPH